MGASPGVQTLRLGGGLEEFELDFSIDFPWKITYLNEQQAQLESIQFMESDTEFMDEAFGRICKCITDFANAKIDFYLEKVDEEDEDSEDNVNLDMISIKIRVQGDSVRFLNFMYSGSIVRFKKKMRKSLKKL